MNERASSDHHLELCPLQHHANIMRRLHTQIALGKGKGKQTQPRIRRQQYPSLSTTPMMTQQNQLSYIRKTDHKETIPMLGDINLGCARCAPARPYRWSIGAPATPLTPTLYPGCRFRCRVTMSSSLCWACHKSNMRF